MSVTLGGVAVPNLQGITLPNYATTGPYYFGFGGGTGGYNAKQEVKAVHLTVSQSVCL